MGAYIVRRILISIPVLIGITIIGFVALKLAPGDPLLTSVNPEVLANLMSHPELLEAERHRLGFDQPIFPNQYLTWVGNLLQGDLGYSITSHRSIVDEIGSRIPQTLLLMVGRPDDGDLHRHPDRRHHRGAPVFEARLRAQLGGDLPGLDAGLRARPDRDLRLRGQPPRVTDGPDAHGRADRPDRRRLPPHPAGHRAGHRQRRAARPLHAGEHARGAQQRVRHDRPLEGPVVSARHHASRVPERAHPDHHDHGPADSRRRSPARSSPSRSSPGTGWASWPSRQPARATRR